MAPRKLGKGEMALVAAAQPPPGDAAMQSISESAIKEAILSSIDDEGNHTEKFVEAAVRAVKNKACFTLEDMDDARAEVSEKSALTVMLFSLFCLLASFSYFDTMLHVGHICSTALGYQSVADFALDMEEEPPTVSRKKERNKAPNARRQRKAREHRARMEEKFNRARRMRLERLVEEDPSIEDKDAALQAMIEEDSEFDNALITTDGSGNEKEVRPWKQLPRLSAAKFAILKDVYERNKEKFHQTPLGSKVRSNKAIKFGTFMKIVNDCRRMIVFGSCAFPGKKDDILANLQHYIFTPSKRLMNKADLTNLLEDVEETVREEVTKKADKIKGRDQNVSNRSKTYSTRSRTKAMEVELSDEEMEEEVMDDDSADEDYNGNAVDYVLPFKKSFRASLRREKRRRELPPVPGMPKKKARLAKRKNPVTVAKQKRAKEDAKKAKAQQKKAKKSGGDEEEDVMEEDDDAPASAQATKEPEDLTEKYGAPKDMELDVNLLYDGAKSTDQYLVFEENKPGKKSRKNSTTS